MRPDDRTRRYHAYLDCLNRQDWPHLGQYVHYDVRHNGQQLGLAGYRAMLADDFRAIPDMRFAAEVIVSQPPQLAARLQFDRPHSGDAVRS